CDDYAMVETLRRYYFDAVVIFTVYSQSALPAALLCHMAGIPLSLAHSRENPYWLLSHWIKETEPVEKVRHEVQRQLDLVDSVGATYSDTRLSFATRQTERQSLKAVLRAHNVAKESKWIVMHCGATAASRRYSPQRYARVISLLYDSGYQVMLTGSGQEKPMIEGIAMQCSPRNHVVELAGKLTL